MRDECTTAAVTNTHAAKPRFRMNNILVPTDFSAASRMAVMHAQGLSALFGAQLHLIHVVAPIVPPEAASSVERLVKDAEEQFHKFVQEENINWPPKQMRVVYGDMLEELNKVIEENEIDLVVIGSSAPTGAKRLLLGSMAQYIFRNLEAPVLAMGPQVERPLSPQHPIRHLLLCESLVPEAESAMYYGCALAENTGADVTVMHTLPEILKDSPRALHFQRMFEQELQAGRTRPDSLLRADYVVTFGDTARDVVRVAKSVGADLIVLGAKPAELWETHLGRGTAHRILGQAPCPILSVCNCYGKE